MIECVGCKAEAEKRVRQGGSGIPPCRTLLGRAVIPAEEELHHPVEPLVLLRDGKGPAHTQQGAKDVRRALPAAAGDVPAGHHVRWSSPAHWSLDRPACRRGVVFGWLRRTAAPCPHPARRKAPWRYCPGRQGRRSPSDTSFRRRCRRQTCPLGKNNSPHRRRLG